MHYIFETRKQFILSCTKNQRSWILRIFQKEGKTLSIFAAKKFSRNTKHQRWAENDSSLLGIPKKQGGKKLPTHSKAIICEPFSFVRRHLRSCLKILNPLTFYYVFQRKLRIKIWKIKKLPALYRDDVRFSHDETRQQSGSSNSTRFVAAGMRKFY